MGRKRDLENFDTDWNYSVDTVIDKDRLDEEAARQPDTFMKYSALASTAIREYGIAWEYVKTLRSELILAYREENPKAKNDEVEAIYRTNPRYKKAKEEMIQAEFVKNILEGAVMAMHQKKAKLADLVTLHGQNYFSSVRAEGARETAREEEKKAVDDRIHRSLNRKRKRSGRKR